MFPRHDYVHVSVVYIYMLCALCTHVCGAFLLGDRSTLDWISLSVLPPLIMSVAGLHFGVAKTSDRD